MPLVRISLRAGKPRADIRAIADGVHQALIDTYGVPPGDRFLLISQHEPEDLIFDADHLGIHRTADIVMIYIAAGNRRDTATRKRLDAAIADRLVAAPGLRRENVQVILSSNERDDRAFGNGLASCVPDAGPAEGPVA